MISPLHPPSLGWRRWSHWYKSEPSRSCPPWTDGSWRIHTSNRKCPDPGTQKQNSDVTDKTDSSKSKCHIFFLLICHMCRVQTQNNRRTAFRLIVHIYVCTLEGGSPCSRPSEEQSEWKHLDWLGTSWSFLFRSLGRQKRACPHRQPRPGPLPETERSAPRTETDTSKQLTSTRQRYVQKHEPCFHINTNTEYLWNLSL